MKRAKNCSNSWVCPLGADGGFDGKKIYDGKDEESP